jgi:hypothetical protein
MNTFLGRGDALLSLARGEAGSVWGGVMRVL